MQRFPAHEPVVAQDAQRVKSHGFDCGATR
jgi:hypothetical protein